MALSECIVTTDRSGRELLQHGTVPFPVACYQDDFRKMNVPWHWHEELEAVIITAGSCTVAAGNEKYTLHAGEGFFINSGILHGCWDMEGTGCMFHSLVFHPRLVGGSLDSVFHQRYIQPLTARTAPEIVTLSMDMSWQKQALEAIEAAWQDCVGEAPGYEFRVRNSLSQLIFLLHANMPAAPAHTNEKNLRDAQRIKTMLSFIHDHFSEELSTKAIAASCTVSESECLRCFRSTIGTTPIQYLRRYRIQQASAQLTATGDKISDIAARCGFQDMSYFTSTFREMMGRTPTEYRKDAD